MMIKINPEIDWKDWTPAMGWDKCFDQLVALAPGIG
jgi:hypothetical protein